MISIIGCGYWGKNLIRTVNSLNYLYSVHDLDSELQKKFQQELKLENLSYMEMLTNDDVKGVMIATSANTHYDLALECLKHNKHVFIEKPICLDLGEGEHLREVSKEKKLTLMVGHLLQYHSHFIRLKEIVRRKELGEIVKIKSTRKSFGIIRDYEDVVWSFAPHDLSMILSLIEKEEPTNFSIKRSKYFNENTDKALINFRMGEVVIDIEVDWTSIEKKQSIEIYGEKGVLVFEDSNPDSTKKLAYYNKNFCKNELKLKNTSRPEYILIDENTNPLQNECMHFINCIDKNVQPITDASEALAVLKVLLELEKINEK